MQAVLDLNDLCRNILTNSRNALMLLTLRECSNLLCLSKAIID